MNVDDDLGVGGLLKANDIKDGLKKKSSSVVLVLVILNGEVMRSCQGQPVKHSHLERENLLNFKT